MSSEPSVTIREMIIASLFGTALIAFPIIMSLFFGETLSLGLWFGVAWGLVAGILLGRLILRNPNVKQTVAEIDHGTGVAQVQHPTIIGMIVGSSGLVYAVLFGLLGEDVFVFLIFGIVAVGTIVGWTMVIALWRDRKK